MILYNKMNKIILERLIQLIQNYTEVLVSEVLEEVIKNYNICKCEKCIGDVKSIALNNLQPKYFLSDSDEGEKKAFLVNRQNRTSALAMIIEAIEKVSQNPHNK